ncbi:MAG: BrxA/BrxB family bacilliredoxin [Chitinophagales bacterium]|nr:BrxA/BrxB family bacilliredoxin [Chitinophagales bacterium]MDW8428723.1 BrxA/BrxB family bacilliredoxin [Chitinophagales bacterium]
MYPEELVLPMIRELTNEGFEEIKTAEQARKVIEQNQGTLLVVINSVCGCAAGSARPAVLMSLRQATKKPDRLVTVFAGVDKEATQEVRRFLAPYPPSSPAIALFRDSELVHMIERHQIEGRPAEILAQHLRQVYEHYC